MLIRKKKQNLFERISITTWIIIINVIMFFIILISLYVNPNNINYFALNPSLILQGKYIFTIITHIFSHASPGHLFVNMFALASFGKLCEKIIGRKRFAIFYITAGLIAAALSIILPVFFGHGIGEKIFGSPSTYMLGTSGTIFGIAGLFVILLPRLRFSIIFLPFWSFQAYKIIPAILIIMWALSISIGLPIGNVAHLGGFLAGIFYGLYLKSKYKNKVAMLQRYFPQ
jgi:membrane associated rhomboid family serine protease